MARNKRIKSETGIYHVMLRGINQQQVFYDKEDSYKFINILSKVKAISGFKLYAYCLMGNHVHILIQEGTEPLDLVFKRLGDRYIYWYNLKYKRSGPLFQGRYKSMPINDDAYFISALRYIHQNPVKAGLTKNCKDYQFSSYSEYFKSMSIVDKEFPMELIGENQFESIHNTPCLDHHLEIKEQAYSLITDEEAMRIIERISKCKNTADFQRLPADIQMAHISTLKKKHLSERQISRLTGVSRYIIRNN